MCKWESSIHGDHASDLQHSVFLFVCLFVVFNFSQLMTETIKMTCTVACWTEQHVSQSHYGLLCIVVWCVQLSVQRGSGEGCGKQTLQKSCWLPTFFHFFHTLAINELLVIAVLVKASLCQTLRTQNTLLIPHQKITVSVAIERAWVHVCAHACMSDCMYVIFLCLGVELVEGRQTINIHVENFHSPPR